MIALRKIGWSCPISEEETTVMLFYSVSLEGVSSHLLSVCTITVRITKLICRREHEFPITRQFPELGWAAQGNEAMYSCEKSIVFCISYFSVAVGKIPPTKPRWGRKDSFWSVDSERSSPLWLGRHNSKSRKLVEHTSSSHRKQRERAGNRAGCKPSLLSLVIDFLQKGFIFWRLNSLLKWGPSIQIQEAMGDSSHSKPPPWPSNWKSSLKVLWRWTLSIYSSPRRSCIFHH